MAYVQQKTWLERHPRGVGDVMGPPLSAASTEAQAYQAGLVLGQTQSDQQQAIIDNLTAGIQYRDQVIAQSTGSFMDFLTQHQAALAVAAAALFGLVLLRPR